MSNAIAKLLTLAFGVCLAIRSRGFRACHLSIRNLLFEPKCAASSSPSRNASRKASLPRTPELPPPTLPNRFGFEILLEALPNRFGSEILLDTLPSTIRGGAGALMWFAIFEETRSESDQTRREPLFSSMETPVRTLMVRRWSILGNVVAKALNPGLTRKTRCRQRISVFRIFRALPRFKIGLEVARN